MIGDLGQHDDRRIALISKAIFDGGLSFAAQKINRIDAPEEVLYWECLARLTDSDGSVHEAGAFAPYLELRGQSFDLDSSILDLVLQALADDPKIVLGCNISAANLSATDRWSAILNRIGAHPELTPRLILEITETYPMFDAAAERLATARALGCRLALDDFGTGFATRARLLSIEVDIVKIDASFVRGVGVNADGRDTLHRLVEFAARAAPVVVVEGVETEAQLEAARAAGAPHVQGFLFSRPRVLPDAEQRAHSTNVREPQ